MWGNISGYEKIPQSNTERGMIDMSDFELLSLVVMTANLIVQILIYIKKKWAALCPKVYDSFFWVSLRANRSSAALFLFLIINAFDVLSSAKNGNVAGFWWEKSRVGYVMSKSSTPCWKMQKKSYFALTRGERSAIILGRNKENVRYGRFSVNKRSPNLLLIPDVRPSENFAKRRR